MNEGQAAKEAAMVDKIEAALQLKNMVRSPDSTARTNLAYWYPLILGVVPTPETYIFRTEAPLVSLLDGNPVPGFEEFIDLLRAAGDKVGWPCFLRTGHGSDKHSWRDTCFVPDAPSIPSHVARLVEWSFTVDLMGLPTDTWAIRQMLDVEPLFICNAYQGFPVTREIRVFVRDGVIEHAQPYWPPDAVESGRPDNPNWRAILQSENARVNDHLYTTVPFSLATTVGLTLGGYWSVDLLVDMKGEWWVTDLADGDSSFMWHYGSQ